MAANVAETATIAAATPSSRVQFLVAQQQKQKEIDAAKLASKLQTPRTNTKP